VSQASTISAINVLIGYFHHNPIGIFLLPLIALDDIFSPPHWLEIAVVKALRRFALVA
jgi:hypothetical protein